jgi:PHS family inorganic phosphate transporter-like MFS transporter
MPHNADTSIKVATSAGAIFGQLFFGYLGDCLGRKKMYGVELMIIISTTLAQSLCGESATLSIVGVLIFYRVVMGVGVGGDCKYHVERSRSVEETTEMLLPNLFIFFRLSC